METIEFDTDLPINAIRKLAELTGLQDTASVATSTAIYFQGERINELLRQYNRVLTEKGFGIRRGELKKKDIIDARAILKKPGESFLTPDPRVNDEERTFAKNNWWYCCVPCFTEGVIQVNDGRYIYWNMPEIKPYENRMTLILHDYIFYKDSGWQPGVSGTVDIEFPEETNDVIITIDEDEIHLYSDIYSILNLKKDLSWSNSDIKLWTENVVENAKDTEKSLREDHGTDNVQELAKLFINYMIKVNHMLFKNKPVAKRSQNKEKSKTVIVDSTNNEQSSSRKIRTIGTMSITSSSIPRLPTEKTIIRYKVASWKTRGFIRTYSNGKKVMVKPSVHHRKCLEQKQEQNVTIRFKNKGDKL